MISDIFLGIIACVLVVWLSIASTLLFKLRKGLGSVQRNVQHVANESIELMHRADELIDDIQSKSDSLDVVFKPLKAIKRHKVTEEVSDTFAELAELIGVSLSLFHRIKHAVKKREK